MIRAGVLGGGIRTRLTLLFESMLILTVPKRVITRRTVSMYSDLEPQLLPMQVIHDLIKVPQSTLSS